MDVAPEQRIISREEEDDENEVCFEVESCVDGLDEESGGEERHCSNGDSVDEEPARTRRTIGGASFFLLLAASAIVALSATTLLLRRGGGGPSEALDGSGDSSASRSLAKRKGHFKPPAPASPPEPLSDSELRSVLDFAIVGFPKTGTSFMEHYLFNSDKETHLDNREHCLGKEDDRTAVENLVNLYDFKIGDTTQDGVKVKNAIKCPHELLGKYNLANYEKYLPDIKFVVSTRHPVLWFQSWYNYKLRQTNKHSKDGKIWAPDTKTLIGPCSEDDYHYGAPNKSAIKYRKNVCTDGAKFHHALSRFGKTPMTSSRELDLLGHHSMSVHSFPRAKVFLMEIGQFSVDDERDQQLADRFLVDLQDYLGLEHDLPPLYHHTSKPIREEVEDYVIDICDKEHDLVRAELIAAGTEAYLWIRDYFLDSPDVVVSNREHFLELVERWQYDPCEVEAEE